MPSASATGATASGRSPERMRRSRPSARRRATVSTASGRSVCATAMAAVRSPWRNRCSDRPGIGGEFAATPQNAALPARASTPSMMARTPRPGSSTAPSIGHARGAPRARRRRRQRMPARQRQPRRHLQQLRIGIGRRLTTRGSGRVSVPVLSKMTVSASASRSMASPALRMTLARNSAPEATTCTAGMASASAQGQVMMSTAIAVTIASCSEAPASEPADAGQRRGRVHDRRVDARGAVGEPHGARLGARRLVEQLLDLVDQRGAAGRGDAQRQRAGIVEAAGIDRVARRDAPPRRLAGDQALIDLGAAAGDHAVGRHALAGLDQELVAGAQRRDRHGDELAACEAVRRSRPSAPRDCRRRRGSGAASRARARGR